jgi:hypothetical protein
VGGAAAFAARVSLGAIDTMSRRRAPALVARDVDLRQFVPRAQHAGRSSAELRVAMLVLERGGA